VKRPFISLTFPFLPDSEKTLTCEWLGGFHALSEKASFSPSPSFFSYGLVVRFGAL
jgi:hypothetical protein